MNKPIQHTIQGLKARFISSLIFYLKMNQFQYRGLTSGEIEMARPIFGQLIDYTKVKIFRGLGS
ncbi:hypothetical protein [Acinetobacter gyllenbergii]|uniref:hypothetical protein n=1 Tax=Acinetobacter gyllenbergii TaxID=134534 RepID=UPI003AF5BF39